MAALAGGALVLTQRRWRWRRPRSPTRASSTTEIVVGTHQDLSGPIKAWGVPVSNGMKMAIEEINAAGGINGRKIRLIIEDSGYDPKRAVLDTQKLIERDRSSPWSAPMGSPTVLAAQDIVLDAGVTAAVSADRRRIHLQVRSGEAAGTAEVQQPAALRRDHARGAQIHGGAEALQEAVHHASGRRVRQERARRLHPAARGDEDRARHA